MNTDIEIAQGAVMKPIVEVAAGLGIDPEVLELYGKYKAKLPLRLIDEGRVRRSNLILVSAISPTPAGEGKTTVSIGLAQGLNRIGKPTTVVLREPSLGPVFGIKGGATGGGHSQVLPMEDINLHFTGDIAAVEKANNLLAALIDNNIQSPRRSLGIDPRTVVWRRVMDMNDRSLRNLVIGLGGVGQGVPRESGFDITAASEVMAILCLSSGIDDLKRRLGNIFVGHTRDGRAVYARDLKAEGAMAALLKDAIKPNLVQTLEGTPAIIHGGPFANIAQGTNSILATKLGMSCSDFVVTEAGFGSDLGAEKFLDIKCGYAGLSPKAVVLVATLRALRYHGGAPLKEVGAPNLKALSGGMDNLWKHVDNMRAYLLEPVVAINRFETDGADELAYVLDACRAMGVRAVVADVWARGGEGAVDLARAVVEAAEGCLSPYKPLYDWNEGVEDKIARIATRIYGADGVEYAPKAKADLRAVYALGLDKLPVCVAKTQKSLSDDPKLIGRPTNFSLTIREIQVAAGAGFIIPIAGEMMRMPGLPDEPASERIDIDAEGRISGLF